MGDRLARERPEDTLLLARGFLVRLLLKRGVKDPKRLIFTGRACAYIRQRYDRIGDLSRGMETLGYRLQIPRDVIEMSDGRLRVPVETLQRHLPGVGPIESGRTTEHGGSRGTRPPPPSNGAECLDRNERVTVARNRSVIFIAAALSHPPHSR